MRWMRPVFAACAFLLAAIGLVAGSPQKPSTKASRDLIGRWDLTVKTAGGEHPAWLEVRRSGNRTLVGSLVWQFGSARPIAHIHSQGESFHFTVPPQWESRKDDLRIEGKLDGQIFSGATTDETGKPVTLTGKRAPTLKRERPPSWASAVELFNGKDLAGWRPRHDKLSHGWIVKDGLLVNSRPGNDLLTEQKFTDFQLHAEFRYPRGSNSGIYLRGRYELQIEDNYGDEPDCHKIGGIYGFLTPSVNAAKKPGEWQTIDLTLVGRVLSVTFNGERIIDRQTIPGITGGALDSDEGSPGPIMLQGDHGPIDFRKVKLTPAL